LGVIEKAKGLCEKNSGEFENCLLMLIPVF
jgi:hypothetical protein